MTVAAAPSSKRPPLPGKQKAAAAFAGVFGFGLCSIGWVGIATAFVVLVLGASLASLVASSGGLNGQSASQLGDQLDVGQLLLPLIVIGVVGLVVWLLGVLISRGILKLSGHPRPGAVTFTGLLIAIVLSTVLDAIVGGVFSTIIGSQVQVGLSRLDVSSASSDPSSLLSAFGSAFSGIVPMLVAWGVVTVVVTIAAGWLSWLWMAIAFRAKSPEQLAAAQAGQFVPAPMPPTPPVAQAQVAPLPVAPLPGADAPVVSAPVVATPVVSAPAVEPQPLQPFGQQIAPSANAADAPIAPLPFQPPQQP